MSSSLFKYFFYVLGNLHFKTFCSNCTRLGPIEIILNLFPDNICHWAHANGKIWVCTPLHRRTALLRHRYVIEGRRLSIDYASKCRCSRIYVRRVANLVFFAEKPRRKVVESACRRIGKRCSRRRSDLEFPGDVGHANIRGAKFMERWRTDVDNRSGREWYDHLLIRYILLGSCVYIWHKSSSDSLPCIYVLN